MKTKEKILDGIRRLLINRGFTALTVRGVAKEARVNHGLVQYYFGSKENMVIAMIDRESKEILKKIQKSVNNLAPESFRKSIMENFILNEASGKLILECLHISNTMPAVKAKMVEILASRRQFLSKALGMVNTMDILVLQANILGLIMLRSLDSEAPLEKGMAHLFSLLGPQTEDIVYETNQSESR